MKHLHLKDTINQDVTVETKWHDSRVGYVTEVRHRTVWAGPSGKLVVRYYGDTQDEARANHSAGVLAAAEPLA